MLLCLCNPERVSGSLITTPYTFETVYTDHQHFSSEEYEELCQDFTNRTRIQFIYKKNFPKSVKDEIWSMTNGHIGYTSTILHYANLDAGAILDELSFMKYLKADSLLKIMISQRPELNYEKLTQEQQNAIKTIWIKESDLVSNDRENYEFFIRNGWFSWDYQHINIFLTSPVSKQLLLMAMNQNIQRPTYDDFTSLPGFMYRCLSLFKSCWMKDTMTKDPENGTILESMWQFEFYRIGSQLLKRDDLINVTVQSGEIEEKRFKIEGKVDFFIDKDRQWAIEFLIRGELQKR